MKKLPDTATYPQTDPPEINSDSTPQPHGRIWPYVVPFVLLLGIPALFQMGGSFIFAEQVAVDNGLTKLWSVTIQSIACAAVIVACWGVYRRAFPVRFGSLAVVVGVAGAAAWIGICSLSFESQLFGILGLDSWIPKREGLNPFEQYNDAKRGWFLVARLSLLCVIVPITEELLLRGWLLRWIHSESDWATTSLSTISWRSMSWVFVYAIVTHPQEAIAAVVWFGMINLLMRRTGNFWDCVLAHSITNLLLGVWIISTGDWRLW